MRLLRYRLAAGFAAASLAACLLLAAGGAAAQVFYAYPDARPVAADQPAVGAGLGFGDGLVRLLGYGRFDMSAVSDVGVEVVLDNTTAWRFGVGGDLRYAIQPSGTTLPFDLSANAGFGFETGANVTTIEVPFGAVVSRALKLDGGREVVPFGGLYVVVSHVSVDVDLPPGIPGDRSWSDTSTDVELRLGGRVGINERAGAHATLHVGHGTVVFFGVNWLL